MSLIAVKKKLLMTQGGGLNVSELFATTLYTGNGSTQTINNGVDLAGDGGLVWMKRRDGADSQLVVDSGRGISNILRVNETSAQQVAPSAITSFNSNGYSLGSGNNINNASYASWTFKKQSRFFDVVTYTGTGIAGLQVGHGLGVPPGMIVVKRVDAAHSWVVFHRTQGASKFGLLNDTAAFGLGSAWSAEPTSDDFTLGISGAVNTAGGLYVAYLFAHDTAADGIIQCGLATGTTQVNLGWRPQFVMIKATSVAGNWEMMDDARGIDVGGFQNDYLLRANLSSAEHTSTNLITRSSAGFSMFPGNTDPYIYLAIRAPTS